MREIDREFVKPLNGCGERTYWQLQSRQGNCSGLSVQHRCCALPFLNLATTNVIVQMFDEIAGFADRLLDSLNPPPQKAIDRKPTFICPYFFEIAK